ncbi:oligosaccharide flippase family protein [Flavobacterium sp. NST-5]|uniref:Oligosaccharide flippase family protein n=1 Tax=Flavobacterium ichthyis TaxID=2698827 RepID=A0ABW9Z7B2_9FLAO|nr:oligosaccharide flippase family protein [Flavobacterium ichthyis]NBL63995.1 oligosaccharide flippase family protein [Flavobacterium ichthyis]
MGIVLKQSGKNIVITYFGFGIGAINALFLYTSFLGENHYGMVTFLLSAANIMMPLMAFGVQSTLIRFYAKYKDPKLQDEFLSFMLLMPWLLIIPVSIITLFGYDFIARLILEENPGVENFLWLIPIIGLFMGYFEIFYAWVKVQMKSVFGNFISEVFVRIMVTCLLLAVYFEWLTKEQFIYSLSITYGLQMLVMMLYAFKVKPPKITFKIPQHSKEIFTYSFFIILSGSIAVLVLDFDKVMIPAYQPNAENAFYAVATFIATVIAVPSRAMLQIIYPITAKLMAEEKMQELNDLYKRSAITLQVFGGLIMLGIFLNINEMYKIIPGNYESGLLCVFLIGLSKFYDVILGNNNAIILNTKYYRIVLLLGILLVILMIVLNMIFIPKYGITGAALATLISVVIYNSLKLWFVVNKMKLFPFTVNTLKSFGILAVVFMGFYFWEFSFHPVLNIILKSVLITVVYVGLNYFFKISPDINLAMENVFMKLKRGSREG